MKKLLLSLCIAVPFFSQSQSITADPALEPMKVVTLLNANVITTQLLVDNIVRLKVPILNKDTINNALPVGTCKIKIGLGTKIILDPSFSLANTNTNNYISWTAVSIGGQTLITGELIQPLPAFYNDTAIFNIKTITVGASTITTNFLVTNHNSPIYLSDFNGTNNTADIPYIIVAGAVPVTFINLFAQNKNCNLNVTLDTENEINVKQYELELSSNVSTFEKVMVVNATNAKRYIFNFALTEKFNVKQLYYRIKSIDVDGKVQYTNIKQISGLCSNHTGITLYPNPVQKNETQVYLQKNNGLFNSVYTLIITDALGKLVQSKVLKLNNVNQFNIATNALASGQYLIKLINNKDNNIEYVKLIKL